ncbi:MAG TPA: hypothetical protein VK499_15050 [Propionibacteriaceae bacterium]|nr:hypothetical protein [Propionibacteriaceae bacterium]
MIVAGDITQQADIDRIVGAAGSRMDGLANVAGVNDDFSPATRHRMPPGTAFSGST